MADFRSPTKLDPRYNPVETEAMAVEEASLEQKAGQLEEAIEECRKLAEGILEDSTPVRDKVPPASGLRATVNRCGYSAAELRAHLQRISRVVGKV